MYFGKNFGFFDLSLFELIKKDFSGSGVHFDFECCLISKAIVFKEVLLNTNGHGCFYCSEFTFDLSVLLAQIGDSKSSLADDSR